MATYIERADRRRPILIGRSDDGLGFLLGVILLLVVLFLLFYYGLPMIRNTFIQTPVVPDKIDVNINTPK